MASDDVIDAAEQTARPVTWQEMTLGIAMIILPMDRDTRDQFMDRLGDLYVDSLQRDGVHELAIAANLLNMFDRVAECVGMLEANGGTIGSA